MKILIVSPSYYPETGAAPSRITNMAEALHISGAEVDVLTCLPNYPKGRIYEGYRGKFSCKENVRGVEVFRYWTFASISKNPIIRLIGMCASSITIWAFAFKNRRINEYDCVIIQTPPILMAASAMFLFRCCYRKTVVLNISDLWPLSAIELGAMREGSIYHKVMARIEKFLYNKSTAYQGQSREIMVYVNQFVPDKANFLYRNLQHDFDLHISSETTLPRKPFKIVYAGLLGVAQNMLELIKHINFKDLGSELHLYGDGNQAAEIKSYLQTNDCGVFYHGSLPKEQMRETLQHYHASVIPLTVRIRGAVPSKLFDLLPLGVPVLFSGGGEGEAIVKENQLGFVSAPGNYEELSHNISKMCSLSDEDYLQLKLNCLQLSKTEFSFNSQMVRYNAFLSSVASGMNK